MKKLTLSIIAFLLVTNMFAQEITAPASALSIPKHEIGASIGMIPVFLYLPVFTYSVNFDYNYNFNKNHSIGLSLSGTMYFLGKGFLPTGYGGKDSKSIWWIAPQLKYRMSYYHSVLVSLYFSATIGIVAPFLMAAYQLNLFGISIGKTHNTFVEIGYGTQGIVKIGYSYKFNSKKNE
ncbi:MAG: hypothetical protein LBV46_03465 [Bacteroidales bacterium]|jgi:hypothetical protein|nr:hypothetical protein [Bacteroidales bacterium]